jgi:integral membrane protein
MRLLRAVALIEAAAFLLLLFVAVPLKHLAGIPEPVLVLGPIHGIAYLAYVWLIGQEAIERGWPRGRALWLIVAGLIPFVPFFIVRSLKAE